MASRGYDDTNQPQALAFLDAAANGTGLLHDEATTSAAIMDDFIRCLGAAPCSPQSRAVQARVAQYAALRGFEPTSQCPNALEYTPESIDKGLARRYMIEEIWRIARETGVTFHRSQALAMGALDAADAGYVSPARRRVAFLRDYPGVRPTPRQTSAGINKLIDLFDGPDTLSASGAPVARLVSFDRAFEIYGSDERGLQRSSPRDVEEMRRLLFAVQKSKPLRRDLDELAATRTRPCHDIRLADWAKRPAAQAKYDIRAWRDLGVPFLPIYHVVTRRDRTFGSEGTWLTEQQLRERLEALASRAAEFDAEQLPCCQAACDELTARLRAAEIDPHVKVLPPSFYRAVVGQGWHGEGQGAGDPLPSRWTKGPGLDVWRLACKRGPTVVPEGAEAREAWRSSDEAKEMQRARLAVYDYFVNEWAPRMAYPAESRMHANATHAPDLSVDNTWVPNNEIGYYRSDKDGSGKQVMSAAATRADRDAGRPPATRFLPEEAMEMHRARQLKKTKAEPCPLTEKGTPHLFACPNSLQPSPYVADAATIADPIRRPFVRLAALEAHDGEGVPVAGLKPNQVVVAKMQTSERKALSEPASRAAYAVIVRAAANLPGGCQMFRVGDGAHMPHPRSKAVGVATAWAVYRGPYWTRPTRSRRAGARPSVAPFPDWKSVGGVAFGGCLGPGASINSGEVAAAIGCLREAIHERRTFGKAGRFFNVLYGIDSDSCADEMDRYWMSGNLSDVAASTIAPLVETWIHLRREFQTLGGHFQFVKFPGHQGVYAMAGADACAKACLAMEPAPIELTVHSTLAILRAIPLSPHTRADVPEGERWSHWSGTPSPHAYTTKPIRFFRGRVQGQVARALLRKYEAEQPESLVVIDRVQAGLEPPSQLACSPCWGALLKHFNTGVWLYGVGDQPGGRAQREGGGAGAAGAGG